MTLIAHKGAVDLLLKIIESRNARLSGAIIRANFNEAGLVLLGSDLLTKVGQTDVVATMDDYEDEPARVEWSPKQESYGFYSGRGKWVSVPADDLTLYGLKMPNFLNQLLVCVFRGDAPTDSDLMRPPVPISSAHRFRGMRPPL